MAEDKRKNERFDFSVVTRIGMTDGSAQQSLGLTKNFSREGLSIETRDFDFIPDNNIKLELNSPKDNTKVPLIGNVVWKRQEENTHIAGLKLIFKDEKNRDEILQGMAYVGNIPIEDVFPGLKVSDVNEAGSLEKPVQAITGEEREPASEQAPEPGFKKEYIENGECKVTFMLPEEAARDAQNVTIVGDFNEWNPMATPMTKLENGSYQITLTLKQAHAYMFRYLIDDIRWENDWCADKYVPNEFGSDNSVVIV